MASQNVFFDKGWVGLKIGTSAPSEADALEVYGAPNVKRVPTVLDDRTYSPQGDARPSVIGRESAQVALGTLRAREATIPSGGGTRPNYDRVLRCCGYPATYADKRSVSGEDTGLRGDGAQTVFVFLLEEFPIKAATSFTITDGTQTITVGTDDAVTGDGEAVFGRLTGYVKATFDAAPSNGATISVSYTSGYRVRYDRANSDAGLEQGYVWVTRLHEELDAEDVRRAAGFRGNAPFAIGQGQNLEWAPTGIGTALAQTANDPALEPEYAHEGANLVWDEDSQVALYQVTADGADAVLYVGHVPSWSVEPGFEVVEPPGAISPGYAHAAQLRPTAPRVRVQLYTALASILDLEAALASGAQFNCRCATPGRVSASNVFGQGFRGQIVSIGDPQEGPNGREVVEVEFKPLTAGNSATVAADAAAPLHYYHACTTV